jgi:acetyl esterase/lipase
MAAVIPDIVVTNFDYVRHDGAALALRLFRPAIDEACPVVINLHGGAWNNGDLNECRARDEALASGGVASAAIDFRQAADGYPTSLADINLAVRWIKAKAAALGLDGQRVGLAGQSSGGHLAMLAAMRPDDERYCSLGLEEFDADASVNCVGMTWPVINPLSRYRHALRLRAGDAPPKWVGDIPERHDTYWKTEATMEEGNPLLALERGENVQTPPAIWIQGTPDPVHDYRDPESAIDANEPERFARRYREAGGEIEVAYIDQAQRASQCQEPLVRFFQQHL